MKEAMMIAVLAVVILFGYFMMGRVDGLMDRRRKTKANKRKMREPAHLSLDGESDDDTSAPAICSLGAQRGGGLTGTQDDD